MEEKGNLESAGRLDGEAALKRRKLNVIVEALMCLRIDYCIGSELLLPR